MSAADETVKDTLGDNRVGEEGIPVSRGTIGNDYQGTVTGPPVNEYKYPPPFIEAT